MSTETEQARPTLRHGDVVRYTPHTTHCHDGYAIADQQTDRLVLVDTFWSSGQTYVTPDSFEVLFNLDDYEEKPQHTWEQFAPADRQRIPRHHGHQSVYLVRKGALPDLATQIANAEERVARAEEDVRSAQRSLDYRRGELAKLCDALAESRGPRGTEGGGSDG